MNRMRAAVLTASGALVALVAAIAIMAVFGGGNSPSAFATDPKPTPVGDLSGVYDIVTHLPDAAGLESTAGDCTDTVDNDGDTLADVQDPDCQDATTDVFHCIAYQSQGADDSIKTAIQCYTNSPGLGDPNNAIPELPGEGPTGDAGALGPPPPPPYTAAAPLKQYGAWTPGNDTILLNGCFDNLGGALAPNVISVATIPHALEQNNAGPVSYGSVGVYAGQTNANCDSKPPEPEGDPLMVVGLEMTELAPAADSDSDGCTDMEELAKPGIKGCGDDPYNPLDSDPTDVSGSYSMSAIALRADIEPGGFGSTIIPGFFYECLADVQQVGDGKADDSVTARVLCYIDSPAIPVNPEAGAGTGDGLSGAAPPEPFADVPVAHVVLSGQINNPENTIELEGCFDNEDLASPLGNVYVRTHGLSDTTGQGTVELWALTNPGQPTCLDGSTYVDGTGTVIDLELVRQAYKGTPERDTDGDGCPNKAELSDTQAAGGLRDPSNHWDYFNPTHDGLNRVDDILKVVNAYFCDNGSCPEYSAETDRTALVGSNAWDFAKPNGQQRVDDILAAVKSYFHDCSGGTQVDDDTLYP
jgi:hypothetical protein